MRKERKKAKETGIEGRLSSILIGLIFLEFVVFVFLFIFTFSPFTDIVMAAVGQDNVTLSSLLDIGNSAPEIVNITINNGNSIDLTPNATTLVEVVIILEDFNGEDDINAVNATFFDNVASSFGAADDNNNHYANSSCSINTAYGSSTEVNATCTFNLWYYSNNATWNMTVAVNDSAGFTDLTSEINVVNTLLALGLPPSIDYGQVNATAVSDEQIANVTNFGNVMMNLSLSGYGAVVGDGNAMNCTLGATKNISIEYEKHNLSASNLGALTFAAFESNYTNLTSSVVVNEFGLNFRQNDGTPYLDDTNTTYWRIYVPLGVAGDCSGNIVFGAVQGTAG